MMYITLCKLFCFGSYPLLQNWHYKNKTLKTSTYQDVLMLKQHIDVYQNFRLL